MTSNGESKSTVGIALLGAGIFAREAHLPAIKALGRSVSLKAIYSRSKSSADALALLAKETLNLSSTDIPTYYDDTSDPNTPSTNDLDALLTRKDIDAVVIALPISFLPSVVLKCLAAGKHVLSEKPIAPTVDEGLSLIKTFNETYKVKGLHWRVAENYEAEPIHVAARKAILDGKIGEVKSIDLRFVTHIGMDNKYYKTSWRATPEHAGGFVLDGGVHFAAAIRTILPEINHPVSLSAHASLSHPHLAPYDTIHAIFTLASPPSSKIGTTQPPDTPPLGIFQLSFGSPKSRSESCINVAGTKGYLTIVPFNRGSHYRLTIHMDRGDTEEIVMKHEGVEKEHEHFAKLILGKEDDGFGHLEGALRDVEFIEKALKSRGNELRLDAASGL